MLYKCIYGLLSTRILYGPTSRDVIHIAFSMKATSSMKTGMVKKIKCDKRKYFKVFLFSQKIHLLSTSK